MKLYKNFIVAAILIFAFSANMQAQPARFYKANLLYDAMSYAEAIPKYIKVIKNDSSNKEAKIKLADCYRLTNNIHKSVIAYEEIVTKQIGSPLHKLYYAQALMATGNYEEAKKYMAEYNSDSRGGTFTKAMADMNKFFKDSACYATENLPFNSTINDFSPALLDNKIVFTSSRKRSSMVSYINTWTYYNYFNLYYTQRKADGKFTTVKRFSHSKDNRYNDGPISFSSQGIIYVTRNTISENKPIRASDGQIKLQLYYATLNKKSNGYEYLTEFEYNNKEYNLAHAAISPDGSKLFFSSDMPGGKGGMDLWVCVKEGETWATPKNLGPMINTEGNEVFPYVTGKTLYFSSNGLEGIGGLDIFMATLDDKNIPSGKPYNIGIPMNSTGDDFGVSINDEGNAGYFSSNRKELNMNDDIYWFTYDASKKQDVKITGVIVDNENGTVLPGSTLLLLNENNEVIEEITANENGNFSFTVLENQNYIIKGIKEKYDEAKKNISTITIEKIDEIKTDLRLNKSPITINVTDTVYMTVVKDTNRYVRMNQKLDSAGYKKYYARVQVGAFYYKNIDEFKNYYPSLKTREIYVETLATGKERILKKYMLEEKYTTIKEAAVVQREMWTTHKITDAFVVIYNMENERIAIYNTIKGEFVILKGDQKPVYF